MYVVDEINSKYFNGDDLELCPEQLAVFLKDNPDCIYICDCGTSLFCYSSVYDKFLYRRPNNSVRNKWYEARGLFCWFRRFLNRVGVDNE